MSSISLETIVTELHVDSAAIMAPDEKAGHLYCYDSYNMPRAWVELKNPLDEKRTAGNVYVYKTGNANISNHIRTMFHGYMINSVMIVPIYRGAQIVATLELIRDKNDKEFTESDQQAAEIYALALEPQLELSIE